MAGGHRGLLPPSGFWGDGIGLMQHHMPAPQPGRCRGARGDSSATITSPQEDGV